MKVSKTLKEAIDMTYEKARYMGSDNPRAYSEFKSYIDRKFTEAYLKAENNPGEMLRLKELRDRILNDETESKGLQ